MQYRYEVQVTLVTRSGEMETLPSMYAQTWQEAERLFENTLQGSGVDPERSTATVFPNMRRPPAIHLYYKWGRVNVR